jgi:uncharacterized membrane protein YfcA
MKVLYPLLIIIGLIALIWTPFVLGYYDLLTAVIVTFGAFTGGYIGEKLLKKKKNKQF